MRTNFRSIFGFATAIGVAITTTVMAAPTEKPGRKTAADRPNDPQSVRQRSGQGKTATPDPEARKAHAKHTTVKTSKTRAIQSDASGTVAGGPVNDDCANASEVSNGVTAFDTTGATTDGPSHVECDFFGDNLVNQDIWFNYTATCSGTLTVSLCGSLYDTKIAIYDTTDCVGDIRVCGDDFCGLQSQVTTQVVSGNQYKIRVGGFDLANGSGTMNITCGGGGGGGDDSCEDATPISDGATPFTTVGATTDGPPDSLCDAFGDDQVNQDIWFNYTASCTGVMIVSLCGSGYDTKVALYEGDGCVGNILACNDDSCGLQSTINANVEQGNVYKLRVGGFGGATGSGTINISCSEPSGNDSCSGAITINDGATPFNNLGATTDGSPDGLCDFFGDDQVNQDVWFNYTATCDGNLIVSLCGSGFDTKVALYEGNGCVGPIVACNDDSCGLQSVIVGSVSLGGTYKLRVGAFGTATGTGTINITCAVPSGNDSCSEASVVTDGTTLFDTFGATTDGPPNDSCNFFGDPQVNNDIWFEYVATCSQTLTVDLCGSFFDTKLAVYAGTDCVGDILACNDDSCGLQSKVLVGGVTEGQTYKIRVGGFGDSTGTGTMLISCGAGPCDAGIGDCCAAHDTPGCEDSECCSLVCGCDPFCCETEWDDFCATTGFVGGCGAQLLCENQPCFIPPPENDLCGDAIAIVGNSVDYTNIGTTNDGPELPVDCDEGFGTDFGSDVWFTWVSDCTGTVTFSTCDTVDYDSRLAVYEGCGCPASNDTIAGCNDDGTGCGLTSSMDAFVTAGACYLLRVGGYAGAQGAGTLNISCDPVNPACIDGVGDCLSAHGNGGCSEPICCDNVCDEDPFCCDVEWDGTCANLANIICVAPPNDECENAPIEQLPHTYNGSNINADPDCALFSPPPDQVWIAFELTNDSSVTLDYCGSSPTFGNAWLNLALGCPCSDFTEGATFDLTSCGDGNVTMTWQCLPAGVYYYPVLTEPGAEGIYNITVTASECIDPCAGATGDCFVPHPTPGCADNACCNTVCDIDPFCCGTEWDDICVDEANDLCGGGGTAPPNDLCANAIAIATGTFEFTTVGSGTDGPGLPTSCDEGFGLSFTNDVWYNFTPPLSGDATITLCEGVAFDSRISLYQGCGCPATNANLVACNDDGCGDPGTPSTLTVPVVGGTCYKLRVGGFGGSTGPGQFDITLSGIDCPSGTVTFTTPPSGVVDARQPNTPAGGPLLGISSVQVSGPAGAPAGCWSVCETTNGGLTPNSIANVTEGAPGSYTVTFARPITPGAVTTVEYLGNNAFASYIYHPANANGDTTANSIDILRLIDFLNGVQTPPWGIYSTDIDRSGAANPADILRLIDLLNGAGELAVWNNVALPGNPGSCP